MPPLELDLPEIIPGLDQWGGRNNAALLTLLQAVNNTIASLDVRSGHLWSIHTDGTENDLGALPVAPGGTDAGVASYLEAAGSLSGAATKALVASDIEAGGPVGDAVSAHSAQNLADPGAVRDAADARVAAGITGKQDKSTLKDDVGAAVGQSGAARDAVDGRVGALALTVDGGGKQITGPFFWRGGSGNTPITAKPLGDGKGGVVDIVNDDTTGYLFHTHSGTNSGSLAYHYGAGLDLGAGGGFLFAAKNSGKGLSGTSHPSHTGVGVDLTFYSSSADSTITKLFSGAKPLFIQQKKGKGFGDGVAVSGGTGKTFTSATAAFTAGDVGQSISQLTSRGEPYCIPAGATIASVNSATSVELSAPLLAAATGINFLVAGRAVPTGQKYLTVLNGDDVEQFYLANNGGRINTTWEVANGPASVNHNSVWWAGSQQKFYTYSGSGTDYVASEFLHDAFGLRMQHYAAAGKGTETSPVRSIIGRNISGSPAIGFLGASATTRPSVTGSRGGNTALTSLITALATLGLVTDSTTA